MVDKFEGYFWELNIEPSNIDDFQRIIIFDDKNVLHKVLLKILQF